MSDVNVLFALIVAWNAWTIVGALLFVYFAWRRDDLITRRYPKLTLVQLLALNVWVNSNLPRTDLRLQYAAPVPAMTLPLTQYILQSLCIPYFMYIFSLKGFSLANEVFSLRKMLHEAVRETPFDVGEHLTAFERRFFRFQQRLFGPAGPAPDSSGIVRRYTRAFLCRALLAILALTLLSIPAGLLCAGCFLPGIGYPLCMQRPYWVYLYFPLVFLGFFYVISVPSLLFMLRQLDDDPFRLKSETWFNSMWLLATFQVYLVLEWTNVPFPDSFRGGVIFCASLPMLSVSMIYFPVACCIWRIFKTKKKESAAGTTSEAFQRLLNDRSSKQPLLEALAANYCIELGLFWYEYLDAQSLVASPSVSADEREMTLQTLYRSYIQPGAHRELNLTHAIRSAVTAEYRQGTLSLEAFAPVGREVYAMLFAMAPRLLATMYADWSVSDRAPSTGSIKLQPQEPESSRIGNE